jgi:hypothetical protein
MYNKVSNKSQFLLTWSKVCSPPHGITTQKTTIDEQNSITVDMQLLLDDISKDFEIIAILKVQLVVALVSHISNYVAIFVVWHMTTFWTKFTPVSTLTSKL